MPAPAPEMNMPAPPDVSGAGDKTDKEPSAEVTLCIYQDGSLALRVDDGDKVKIKDLDTAVAAIRRFAEAETSEAGQQPGQPEGAEAAGPEAAEERGFQQSFAGA